MSPEIPYIIGVATGLIEYELDDVVLALGDLHSSWLRVNAVMVNVYNEVWSHFPHHELRLYHTYSTRAPFFLYEDGNLVLRGVTLQEVCRYLMEWRQQ